MKPYQYVLQVIVVLFVVPWLLPLALLRNYLRG